MRTRDSPSATEGSSPHDSGEARVHHARAPRAHRAGRAAPALRRDARRPQARRDGGRVELRTARLRQRTATGTVEVVYELENDRLIVEVYDNGQGFVHEHAGADRGGPRRGRARHRDHPGARGRVRGRRSSRRHRLAPPVREAPLGIAHSPLHLLGCSNSSTWRRSRSPTTRPSCRVGSWTRSGGSPRPSRARASCTYRDSVRRRRRRDRLHADPAHARRGARCRVADHQGQDEFFDVTKRIHNALQGGPTG